MLSKSENLLHKLETNLQQNQKISIEEITESMDEKKFVECVQFIYEQMCSWIDKNDKEALKLEVYGLGKLLMEYKADTNK